MARKRSQADGVFRPILRAMVEATRLIFDDYRKELAGETFRGCPGEAAGRMMGREEGRITRASTPRNRPAGTKERKSSRPVRR